MRGMGNPKQLIFGTEATVWIHIISYAMGTLALMFVATALGALVMSKPSSEKNAYKSISIHLVRFRSIVYSMSVALAVAVITFGIWILGPIWLLPDDALNKKLVVVYSQSLLFYIGAYFTIVLIAAYLPLAALLRRRLEKLQEGAIDVFGAATSNSKIESAFPLGVQLRTAGAILSPVLISLLPKLLEVIILGKTN
jgi:hypothetical protein